MLAVHLEGYLNVLDAALPLMAAAGYGRIVGVTSGSGWRAADAGAYSCAKRAVAALTWQLGRQAPPGVTVNAMSPIAATRMMASALERARQGGPVGRWRDLLPLGGQAPRTSGPFGAHLVGEEFGWCSGQVLFAGGPEVAVIDEPRLLEVVRTDHVVSLARVLDEVIPGAFAKAESRPGQRGRQQPPVRARSSTSPAPPRSHLGRRSRSCVVVSDRPRLAASLTAALEARSIRCHRVEVAHGFGDAAEALNSVVEASGPIDAVVVALAGGRAAGPIGGWMGAGARRAPRDRRAHPHRCRMGPGGRRLRRRRQPPGPAGDAHRRHHHRGSQSSPGLGPAGARCRRCHRRAGHGLRCQRRGSGGGRRRNRPVSSSPTCSSHPEAAALAGAELVVGDGWIGLRSHPRPDRQHHLRWSRPPRLARRDAPGDRRRRRPPALRGGLMTDRPARVVDAHVHLWDPARTDWYPYLSHPPADGAGDASRMFRRFDVDTYQAETAGWNVEKFVNVAAATGRHSIDETIELDSRAQARGGPDAIIGGLPPTDTVAEAVELLDRQMTASRFRGVRPMGRHGGRFPTPACSMRCRSGTCCSS